MEKRFFYLVCGALVLLLVACSKPSTPKEYGYYRIDLPSHGYQPETIYHATFQMSSFAQIEHLPEEGFFNILYPALNGRIHCSYKPVRHNLGALTEDAHEFVYSHAGKATAIPEREYVNSETGVYGVYFELHGNTASPLQFFLTDSIDNFFRGAVYISAVPNVDSLAPVIDYISEDVRVLIESFQWR